MNFALNPLCAKAQVYKAVATHLGVVLVESIIKTFIEVLQVQENHRLAYFHTPFDTVDVTTYLFVKFIQNYVMLKILHLFAMDMSNN